MRYQALISRLSGTTLRTALVALVMPVVLACGILSDDPAPPPTPPSSESPSLTGGRSPKDSEPATGIEFEARATPLPTATPYPTTTPYPTATPCPTATPIPTTVPTPPPGAHALCVDTCCDSGSHACLGCI